jgi:outer membrane protein assembly factor BamB
MSKNGIAQLIFFVAIVIAALGIAGTFVETAGHVSNALDERGDRVGGDVGSDLEIISDPGTGAVWNGSADRVTVLVKNVGQGRLSADPDAVDVLVDDAPVTNESIALVGSADGWYPGEVVRIRFDRSLPDGRHRLSVSAGGATDYLRFTTGSDPVAAFAVDPSPARTDETITFDANDSSDPDGNVAEYRWDFGADGTYDSAGETVTRTWNSPTTVTVRLTVTDDGGNTDSVTRTVRVYPANWRMYGYDDRNTGSHRATTAPTTNVVKTWGYDIGPTDGDDVHLSSAAVVNGTVYIGSDDGSLYALDATNGSVVWRGETGGSVRSSPAVVGGTAYVGSLGGGLYAFDVNDGSETWNVSTGDSIYSPPTVEEGVVYVGDDGGTIHAVYANGTERWSYPTGGDVDGAPAVEDGVIYAGSWDDYLYAIDAENGSLRWRKDVGGDVTLSSPTVVDGTVYLGVYGTNSTIAVNATTRETVWNVSVGGRVRGSPAVVDGIVYVGDGSGTVHALEAATGETVWTEETGGEIWSSVAVANGTAVVTSKDESVYAFDAETGDRYWRYDTGNLVTSSPAILNGTVYVGLDESGGDDVIAIGGDSPASPNATFEYSPEPATEGETIRFDGTDSVDPDGTISGYEWDLDADWTYENTGPTANRTFRCAGDYRVSLAVNDSDSLEDVVSNAITILDGGPETNWPAFRNGPARTGYHPGATGPKTNVTVDRRIDREWIVASSPAVVEDTIYVGNRNGTLFAIDQCRRTVKWTFQANDIVDSSPTVEDGVVYFGSDDTNVYAVHTNNGTEKWSFSTGGWVDSSPIVVDGVVYVGSRDDNVYAIHANNGTEKWSYSTGGPLVFASPTYHDGTIYFGSNDTTVYAVWTNGTTRWTNSNPTDTIRTTPAYANGTVYVTSDDGSLYAFDAATGVERWQYDTNGAIRSSPAVWNDTVYFGNDNYRLHAVWTNGSRRWVWTNSSLTWSIGGSPAVVDGILYVGDEYSNPYGGNLYAIDAESGSKRWYRHLADASVRSSPAVVEGYVYVGGFDGGFYVIEEDD